MLSRRSPMAEEKTVLVVGDHPDGPGGISRVMHITRSALRRESGLRLLFAEPRGRGPSVSSAALELGKLLVGILVRRTIDVVHFNTASKGSTLRAILLACAARTVRLPYVVHLHGGGYRKFYAEAPRLYRSLIRHYFQRSAFVIALTPSWEKFITDELGVASGRVTVIPNGTPYSCYEQSNGKSETPTFVYVGRLTGNKGVPQLLEAFHGLHGTFGAELLLIGAEPDVETSAALQNVALGTKVAGWQDNKVVMDLVSKAWALVLPSHFENMPLTILEAMSVRTAVVATRVGGIPEIMDDGIEGFLVNLGDTNGLREAMKSICISVDMATQMGENGYRRWDREFTDSEMASSLAGVWRAIGP